MTATTSDEPTSSAVETPSIINPTLIENLQTFVGLLVTLGAFLAYLGVRTPSQQRRRAP